MTLEKLQILSGALVEGVYKGRWLSWWNSSQLIRVAMKFPSPTATEDKIKKWLPKAVFWAEFEENATKSFNDIVGAFDLTIRWDADASMDRINSFVERHRIPLYDHAYNTFFSKNSTFDRTKPFMNQVGTQLAMQRVLFRYFHREILRKGGLQAHEAPNVFDAWIDKSSAETYIFSLGQTRAYKESELLACPWYIECRHDFAPTAEASEKNAAGPTAALVDLSDDVPDDGEASVAEAPKKGRNRATKKAVPERTRPISTRQAASVARAAISPAASNPQSNPTQTGSRNAPTLSADNKASFISSQWKAATSLRAEYPGTHPTCLIMQYSIREAIEYYIENKKQSDEQHEILQWAKKVGRGRPRYLGGKLNANACIDLFIADIPDGLRVPHVSNPPMAVPYWNTSYPEFAEQVFEFANGSLSDDGAIMLFLPEDPKIKRIILGDAEIYGYKLLHDIWGVNELYLASFANPERTTKCFYIALFVRVQLRDVAVASTFSIDENIRMSSLETDVRGEGFLQNFTTTSSQLMNGNVPWRGGREKSALFVQMLIESFSKPNDVLFDCNASTGASVHACLRSGRHLVALEADSAIFDSVLVNLKTEEAHCDHGNDKRKRQVIFSDEESDSPIKKVPKDRLDMLELSFATSPPLTWSIPTYNDRIARLSIYAPSVVPRQARNYSVGVLKYIQDEANEQGFDYNSEMETSSFSSGSSC